MVRKEKRITRADGHCAESAPLQPSGGSVQAARGKPRGGASDSGTRHPGSGRAELTPILQLLTCHEQKMEVGGSVGFSTHVPTPRNEAVATISSLATCPRVRTASQ